MFELHSSFCEMVHFWAQKYPSGTKFLETKNTVPMFSEDLSCSKVIRRIANSGNFVWSLSMPFSGVSTICLMYMFRLTHYSYWCFRTEIPIKCVVTKGNDFFHQMGCVQIPNKL